MNHGGTFALTPIRARGIMYLMNKQKFDVDDRGLAMLLERQGELEWPRRLLAEIYQNAVETGVSGG